MMNGVDRITVDLTPRIRSANDWIPDLAGTLPAPGPAQIANLNTALVLPGTKSWGALACRDRLVGGGMRFNGRAGCGVATASTTSGVAPMTMVVLVRFTSSAKMWILSKAISKAEITVDGGTLFCGTSGHLTGYGATKLKDGLLHQIAMTITATGSTVLYLDGLSVATVDNGIAAQSSQPAYIGNFNGGAFPFNGDIIAPAIHDGLILTPAEIASEWNRYSEAKSFILTPDVPTGTYSTAGAWIGPVQLLSGTVVVENTGALAPAPQVQVRSTVAATMKLYDDGHYNGCTGPEVEGYGTFEFWHTCGGASGGAIFTHAGVAGTVGIYFSFDGNVTVGAIGVATLAFFRGASPVGERHHWRLEISKDLATGYQCTLYRDGVKLTADTGSNPTARVAVTLTQPQINISLGAGNSLGYDGMSWSPGWVVNV